MSYNGSYVPTGMQNGVDDHEREQKRRKTSPSGGFKQPQLPNAKPQADERTDINDLSDLVHSSGIDLKREEDLLASSYQYRQLPHARIPQQSDQHQASTQPQTQPSNFDLLNRTSFPAIGQSSTASQQPSVTADPSEELGSQQIRAARARAEAHQYQLNDPFLQAHSMRLRMERIANDHGIKVPMAGLYDKINRRPDPPPPSQPTSGNRPGLTIDTQHKPSTETEDDAPSLLHRGAPLDPLFSLLSLSASERIRGLFEDAFAFARGRQITADGQIPPEYIALVSPADLDPNASTPTQKGASDPSNGPITQTPLALPPSISAVLTAEAATDRLHEEARLRKRAARKARRAATAADANKDPNATSGSGTPLNPTDGNSGGGVLGNMAPEQLAALPKISKKELERQKKADMANEAAATRNANSAVAMALGGKAKYSWMTKGAGGGSGASTPMRGGGVGKGGPSTPATGTGKSGGAVANGGDKDVAGAAKLGKDGLPPKGLDRTYGVWREDGPAGRDVQLRDWIAALEGDGRERKALALAMLRLGREALLESA